MKKLLIILLVICGMSGVLFAHSTLQPNIKPADTNKGNKMNGSTIPTFSSLYGDQYGPVIDAFGGPLTYPASTPAPTTDSTITGSHDYPWGPNGEVYNSDGSLAGTASSPAPDPYAAYGGATNYNNLVGSYDQAINNTQAAINRLPGQQNSVNSSINSSTQDALNQLLGGYNQAKSSYDTNKLQTGQNYVAGKNTVGANAGTSLNSLLRLLGARGAGGGSPILGARGAVTREATLQRNDLGRTFGQNNQALDTNWGNYGIGYNNQVSSVNKQKENNLAQTTDKFNSQNASLLQSLAQLAQQKAAYTGGNAAAASQPYLDQANTLLNGVGNFNYTPTTFQTQAYNAPSLASYTTNPNSTPTVQGQKAGNDFYSPYLSALLGKKQLA